MSAVVLHILISVVAFLASMAVFIPILKISNKKNIVDLPDARKLQKKPVPVMGGIVVFFGILVGICFFKTFVIYSTLLPVLGAMTIMLYIGAIDDAISISPKIRFLVEIAVALLMIYGTHHCISSLNGMWGISNIPLWLAIFLSVVTFLGVVNSINMIDGVDGLSSSFTIMILGFLGVICYLGDEFSYSILCVASMGALLPFFIHNVFGEKTKMFIGDSGTMMIGTLISAMTFVILRKGFSFNPAHPMINFNKIAFVIAVLSIPIADTLRVMFVRIKNGKSPFDADKNHLHHLLIASHFSFFFTTLIELLLNLFVIAVFFTFWSMGMSMEIQLYAVIAAAMLVDWLLAFFLHKLYDKQTAGKSIVVKLADHTHIEQKAVWLRIQKLVDRDFDLKVSKENNC